MKREKRDYHTTELYEAILLLKDKQECLDFFRDICSENELRSIEQRYTVARLLSEGKTYLDIQEMMTASTATISRVGRMLGSGTGAVGRVLSRQMEKEENAKSE